MKHEKKKHYRGVTLVVWKFKRRNFLFQTFCLMRKQKKIVLNVKEFVMKLRAGYGHTKILPLVTSCFR